MSNKMMNVRKADHTSIKKESVVLDTQMKVVISAMVKCWGTLGIKEKKDYLN